jgi:hypothetical protein
MLLLTYPRWQFALIEGKFAQRKIIHPDQEEPDVWKESPADLPPLPEPKPKLNDCCLKLKEKFDVAWAKLKAEHAQQAAVIAGFDAQWEAKVQECVGLQVELDALRATASQPEIPARSTKKK